jgi:hypothetical protein
MATTRVVKPEELDRLEADARRKIEEARAVEVRLSYDALSDPAVQQELEDVRSEREAAEDALRTVADARTGAKEREQAAHEQAEAEAKAKALAEAQALDAPLLAAARKYDKAAGQLRRLADEHHLLVEQRQGLLYRAGVAKDEYLNTTGLYFSALIAAIGEGPLAAEIAERLNGKPQRLEDASDHLTA